MSPRTGRPTDNPKQTQVAVRFDSETLKILDDYCNSKNITRAEGVRQAVKLLKKDTHQALASKNECPTPKYEV